MLPAGTGGHYRLWGPETPSGDLPLILEGELGRPAQAKLGGEPLTLFVSELKARPGTHFSLVHNSPFSTIAGLSAMLKLEEEGNGSGLIRIQLQSPQPAKASTIING